MEGVVREMPILRNNPMFSGVSKSLRSSESEQISRKALQPLRRPRNPVSEEVGFGVKAGVGWSRVMDSCRYSLPKLVLPKIISECLQHY